MMSAPHARNMRDSARVEKRGPSIVTTVPRPCALHPVSAQAAIERRAQVRVERVRHRRVLHPVVETLVEREVAPAREVDELVEDDEVAAADVLAQRADRGRRDDVRAALRRKGRDVRLVRDDRRGELVLPSMAREDDDLDAVDRPGGQWRRRLPVRGRRLDLLRVLEDLRVVEPRSADNPDLHRTPPLSSGSITGFKYLSLRGSRSPAGCRPSLSPSARRRQP